MLGSQLLVVLLTTNHAPNPTYNIQSYTCHFNLQIIRLFVFYADKLGMCLCLRQLNLQC